MICELCELVDAETECEHCRIKVCEDCLSSHDCEEIEEAEIIK